jgi:hypothetical protein
MCKLEIKVELDPFSDLIMFYNIEHMYCMYFLGDTRIGIDTPLIDILRTEFYSVGLYNMERKTIDVCYFCSGWS